MNQTFTLPRFAESWQRYWPSSGSRCGLINCSGPTSFWRRVWGRRNKIRFNGVLYSHQQCLETAIRLELLRLQNQTPAPPPANRMPLGLLMVARGKLTYDQVAEALAQQRKSGTGSIGEWFEKLGFLTEQEVAAALALQWGCPVSLSLEFNRTCHKLPLAILENFLMWPLHHVAASNTLYIAFGKRVDHGAQYAIESMLGCRIQPCVAAAKVIASRIERLRQEPRTGEVEFRSMRDPAEIVRVAVSYIARLGAEEIRSSRLGPFIWLLLKTRLTSLNLLFRLCSDAQPPKGTAELYVARAGDDFPENTGHLWRSEVPSAFSVRSGETTSQGALKQRDG
jgi:hypothetical protein